MSAKFPRGGSRTFFSSKSIRSKGQQKRKEKIDDLKCIVGSDHKTSKNVRHLCLYSELLSSHVNVDPDLGQNCLTF